MAADTIAFVSTYEHPSRDSVERMVREAFPEYRLENIVLKDVVKRHPGWLIPNAFYVASEYGGRLIGRRASLRDCYFQTSYLFRRVRDAMRSIVDPARHVFSFQTQSLYDTSVPGVPHFLYTDHTHLSNLESVFFDRRDLRPPRWRALERTVYGNATRVFVRSHNVQADLEKHYGIGADKAVCVYAGANVNLEQDAPPANDDYSNQNILFVGGDWERKGGPELLQAFEIVLRELPRARLTIVGATPTVSLPNCTVLGKLGIDAVSARFAQATVFCLPTRLEPFGIVVLEAMQHRLPVVATREGALADMVREGITGHLVAPGDSDALAAALLDLLRDPRKCREFGAAGHRLVQERYSWPAVGQKIRGEILQSLKKSPSADPHGV